MKKSTTNGYYFLDIKKENIGLHFSMNAWYNLKKNTGKELSEYGKDLDSGSDMDKAIALADIIHSAAQAYIQEEGLDIEYNIYTVRNWFGKDGISAKQIEGVTAALLWNTSAKITAEEKK